MKCTGVHVYLRYRIKTKVCCSMSCEQNWVQKRQTGIKKFSHVSDHWLLLDDGHIVWQKGHIHLQVLRINPPHIISIVFTSPCGNTRPIHCHFSSIIKALLEAQMLAQRCCMDNWWRGRG